MWLVAVSLHIGCAFNVNGDLEADHLPGQRSLTLRGAMLDKSSQSDYQVAHLHLHVCWLTKTKHQTTQTKMRKMFDSSLAFKKSQLPLASRQLGSCDERTRSEQRESQNKPNDLRNNTENASYKALKISCIGYRKWGSPKSQELDPFTQT